MLEELEREIKEKGGYLMLFRAFDRQIGFFKNCGYTVATVTEDCPKGYRYYGMKKEL